MSWDVEDVNFLLEVQTGRYTSREFVFETIEAPLVDELMTEQVEIDRARQDDIERQIKEEKRKAQQAKEDRESSRKIQRETRQANGMMLDDDVIIRQH